MGSGSVTQGVGSGGIGPGKQVIGGRLQELGEGEVKVHENGY